MGTLTRSIVVVLFIASLIIMICDYVFGVNKIEISFFYAVTNAILILRVFGISIMTWLLHVVTYVAVLLVFFMLEYNKVNKLNAIVLLTATLITFIFAVICLVIDPGNTACKRACHAGLHAFMGLLTAILYFLIVAFAANYNDIQCILEIFYFLLFLIIVLMPSFRTDSHAIKKAQDECERLHAALAEGSMYGSSACSCSSKDREGVRRRRHASAHSRMSGVSGEEYVTPVEGDRSCIETLPCCDRYCTSTVRIIENKDGHKTYQKIRPESLENLQDEDRRHARSISMARARSRSRARAMECRCSDTEESQSSDDPKRYHKSRERDSEPRRKSRALEDDISEETTRRSRSRNPHKKPGLW